MRTNVLEWLDKNKDEKYKNFSSKLLPKDVMLKGVRIPLLHQYAKQLIKQNKDKEYLDIPIEKLEYQEELMLYSILLANQKINIAEKIEKIKNFIPNINSWAVCDIFCSTLKDAKKNTEIYYKTFFAYTKKSQEYQIRFFYVMALNYFIKEEYLTQIIEQIKIQKYNGYYDKMAVAWFLSVAYVKFPQKIENFLINEKIEGFVLKKTISKVNDSFRVTKEAKAYLKTLASNRINK